MCYPVCGTVRIKDHLLLIRKSSPCSSGCGFSLTLNVLGASLNKSVSYFLYRLIRDVTVPVLTLCLPVANPQFNSLFHSDHNIDGA